MTYRRVPAGGSQPTASGTRRSCTRTGLRHRPRGGGRRRTDTGTRPNCTRITPPRERDREEWKGLQARHRVRTRDPVPPPSRRTVRTRNGAPIPWDDTSGADSSSADPPRWSGEARSSVTTRSTSWSWRPRMSIPSLRSPRRLRSQVPIAPYDKIPAAKPRASPARPRVPPTRRGRPSAAMRACT